MASTFKFHSQINETVPWQAQYAFPSQATKVQKQVVKLPPKNGSSFAAGNIVRIEFPADNYLNTLNSVLAFDVTWSTTTGAPRFQRGGAQNLIKRLRIMYGSLVIEDIQEYKTLVRIFTEAGVQNDYMSSSGTILDGMYGTLEIDADADTTRAITAMTGNAGDDTALLDRTSATTLATTLEGRLLKGAGTVATELIDGELGSSSETRTYCLNLLSGLLTCKKLVPLKWMAAQLSIEITLADVADCALYTSGSPTYSLTNVNYIAEMLEFDSTYDTAFFAGLQGGGVPLKFSSWHFHSFNVTGATSMLQIHERSRSVKAAFAVARTTDAASGLIDTDRFFHALGQTYSSGVIANAQVAQVDQFQWRVGGKYYPSQPVRGTHGGAEAYAELLKCLNALGDYTRASNINYLNWVSGSSGQGSKFIMASEFENVDVMPDTISGINAEEQSDIALSISLDGSPSGKKVDVFMHYDSLLIVKAGNVVELVM
jgi:hypothetical protein